MQKKWLISGSIGMIMTFAGCNGENGTDPASNPSAAEDKNGTKTTLQYSAYSGYIWKLVGQGLDVAAAKYYYLAPVPLTDPPTLARSLDGITWTSLQLPAGAYAYKVSAAKGANGEEYLGISNGSNIYLRKEDASGNSSGWFKLGKSVNGSNNLITSFGDLAVREDGGVWAMGNNDNRLFYIGTGNSWPSPNDKWSTWYTQKAVAFTFAPSNGNGSGPLTPVVVNEHFEVWHWQSNSTWKFKNASNVGDICGTDFANLASPKDIWIAGRTGKLNFWAGTDWTEGGASDVNRVGCSNGNKLIIRNNGNYNAYIRE